MAPLGGFGHFYGFAATVNYATTIFKDFSDFLQKLLGEFEVDKLSKERVIYQQGSLIYKETSFENFEKGGTMTGADGKTQEVPSNLEILHSEVKVALARAEEAEKKAKRFLYDIKESQTYKANFRNKFEPLFPLAGTFSVIVLLFSAFGELNHGDHCICFNTIFSVGIVTLMLAIGNYYDFFYTKNKDASFRTFILTIELVFFTCLLWIGSRYIHNNNMCKNIRYDYLNEVMILVFCISISCLGFIAIIAKMIRVNIIARTKYRTFKKVNKKLAELNTKLLSKIT